MKFLYFNIYLLFLFFNISAKEKLSYNRDIQPILSDRCFACHGPDGGEFGEKWEGGLRLDTAEGALADLKLVKHKVQNAKRAAKGLKPKAAPKSSRFAIVPGKPEKSGLIERIMTDDEDDIMPPVDSHLKLSKAAKNLLKQWISEGAKYDTHWSFKTPQKAVLPKISQKTWPKNSTDNFVLAKLESMKLKPSDEAGKVTWLRRVTQDITGLPPTLDAVNQFLKDNSPKAYEKVVDRLLSSVDYAERMTNIWLDNARYADSNGYQFDNARTMWPWRDWVIKSFRNNKPWSEFVTEQLAGDLLPKPTQDQLIATGFNRNHGYSIEGGIINEEYRVTYANDKTTTAGTLFLGLTMECTRCHDHKYDPLTMTDYYSLYAFFNTSSEKGAPGENGRKQKAAAPYLNYKSDADKKASKPLAEKLKISKPSWQALAPVAAKAQFQKLTIQKNASVLASGVNPKNDRYTVQLKPATKQIGSIRLEALKHPTMTNGNLSRQKQGNFVLTNFKLTLVKGKQRTPLSIVAAEATFNQKDFHVSHSIDKNPKSGWAVNGGYTKNQSATYTLDKIINVPEGAHIEAELFFDSVHVNQIIGCFRLSSSSSQKEPAAKKQQKKAPILAMIMKEMPRKSFILKQGLFDKPGKEVTPTTPSFLSSFKGYPKNRLGLAKWLLAKENPLFSRVTVNRVWQQFFGTGIVKSADNFGLQGEQPSHQQMLDWLAVDFRESNWDMHHLIRTIVLSATYRQSSAFRKDIEDPENRLLARGPSFRLPAEMIRDQALAVSGLLSRKVGGPSVKPYQPSGVWEDLNASKSHAEIYRQGGGADIYRKSLYTYWRRAALHPAMMTFDAPSRDVCAVSRESTNTPLQALVTLHGPTYIEASRILAEKFVGKSQAIKLAFQTVLSRQPSSKELAILQDFYKQRLKHYRSNLPAASKLLKVGARKVNSQLNPAELAALADCCHAIFNLSETITRN